MLEVWESGIEHLVEDCDVGDEDKISLVSNNMQLRCPACNLISEFPEANILRAHVF